MTSTDSLLQPQLSYRQMLHSTGASSHIYPIRRAAITKYFNGMRRTNVHTKVHMTESFLSCTHARVEFRLGRRKCNKLLGTAPLSYTMETLHCYSAVRTFTSLLAATPITMSVDRYLVGGLLPSVNVRPRLGVSANTEQPFLTQANRRSTGKTCVSTIPHLHKTSLLDLVPINV